MKHSVENPVEYFNFKNLNFIIHPLFLKTLADKKVNEWKLNNPTITIYAEIINDILRVQHFSNSHGVKGVLVLHDSALSLELANEKLKDFKNLTFFELHVYADIKQYLFQYKIIHLNVENPSRKFTPIEPIDVQFEKLASVVSYPDGIVANDLNHSVYLIRNTMKLSHHNIIKNVANSVALNTQIHVYSQNKSFAVVVSESGSVSINCIHLPIRLVDLKSILDPATLVLESSMLNLSLMKWRILPDFDLKKNTGIKCLILGAGTLGCNVIRCLLGWGVLHFTLVDSGNVSYSNPIRQSLYTVHDVGKSKVESAKLRIMDIAPYATVEAINIRIPMPDHVSDTTSSDTVQLWELIKVHDAIFLLTDSRESRWLPTTLGRYENKIVLTAALGFDSLLALKHSEEQGCYFCSDVVAPSLQDRTLDQQCTVTRPGLSFIASGLISEILVSLMQQPLLGDMPQQVRLFMTQNTYMSSTGVAYDKCTACSAIIMNNIKANGLDFILKCLVDPKSIESLTGLDKIGDVNVEWEDE